MPDVLRSSRTRRSHLLRRDSLVAKRPDFMKERLAGGHSRPEAPPRAYDRSASPSRVSPQPLRLNNTSVSHSYVEGCSRQVTGSLAFSDRLRVCVDLPLSPAATEQEHRVSLRCRWLPPPTSPCSPSMQPGASAPSQLVDARRPGPLMPTVIPRVNQRARLFGIPPQH